MLCSLLLKHWDDRVAPRLRSKQPDAYKTRWPLCSADDPDHSATANSISGATLCACSRCCCSAAGCGTSTWQLVEKQIQAWAGREVSCSGMRWEALHMLHA